MRSNLVDIQVQKHAETEKVVLVSTDGDKEKAVWLPLSQCEIEPTSNKQIFELTLPEWLAKNEGLI